MNPGALIGEVADPVSNLPQAYGLVAAAEGPAEYGPVMSSSSKHRDATDTDSVEPGQIVLPVDYGVIVHVGHWCRYHWRGMEMDSALSTVTGGDPGAEPVATPWRRTNYDDYQFVLPSVPVRTVIQLALDYRIRPGETPVKRTVRFGVIRQISASRLALTAHINVEQAHTACIQQTGDKS